MDARQKAGRLTISAVRIKGARSLAGGDIAVTCLPRGQGGIWEKTYGAVINCTGPSMRPADSGNPIIVQLARTGAAMPHPTGFGFLVDKECRAISASGEPQAALRIVGPLTRGTFMESGSVPAISYQIYNHAGYVGRTGWPKSAAMPSPEVQGAVVMGPIPRLLLISERFQFGRYFYIVLIGVPDKNK